MSDMNLTEVLLKDGDKPVFMSEKGLVERIPKRVAGKAIPQAEGVGLKTLFKKDPKCHYCQCKTELAKGAKQYPNTATIDHKVPVSRGGKGLGPTNKVLACQDCNKDKAHLTEGEYLAVLAYRKRLTDN